ncbi:MAG: GAF domain-containing protein [Chloroflexi bacterium]|nr:GAF domain-containing protein [Chloroflexota bacterium]
MFHEVIPLPDGPLARSIIVFRQSPLLSGRRGKEPDFSCSATASFDQWDLTRQLAALGKVCDFAALSDTRESVDLTLEEVLRVTGAEAAELFLHRRSSSEMVLAAHKGMFQSAFYQIPRFDVGVGFPGLVMANAEPLVTQHLTADPRYLRTRVKEKGVQFYACVPLRAHGSVLGSLNIASRQPCPDPASRLQFLTWVSKPLGLLLDAADLRSRHLLLDCTRYGNEAGQAFLPNPDLRLAEILAAIVRANQARAGKLVLCESPGGRVFRASGHPRPDSGGCSWSESLAGTCSAFPAGKPQVMSRGRTLPSDACRGVLGTSRSALCFPMKATGGIAGILTLLFDEGHDRSLQRLSFSDAAEAAAVEAVLPVCRDLQAAEPESPPPVQSGASVSGPVSRPVPYLDIRCLGDFRIYKRGMLLAMPDFKRRSAAGVLKILVAHRGKPVHGHVLMECLWPEGDPARSRSKLWVAIHSLRLAMEDPTGESPQVILTDGGAYRFNTSISYRTDVDALLTGLSRGEGCEVSGDINGALAIYQAAVKEYGGDFLEDDPYCDWCAAQREYCREVYLSLLKRLGRIHEARKSFEQAAFCYRQILEKDPLREEAHRQLMSCLWAAGRRDEALRQFQECRRILAQELDIEPLAETQALYAKINKDSPGPS